MHLSCNYLYNLYKSILVLLLLYLNKPKILNIESQQLEKQILPSAGSPGNNAAGNLRFQSHATKVAKWYFYGLFYLISHTPFHPLTTVDMLLSHPDYYNMSACLTCSSFDFRLNKIQLPDFQPEPKHHCFCSAALAPSTLQITDFTDYF